jgi:exopolysaccharide biosynthesis polyprenyl glycosylphosphotransferase
MSRSGLPARVSEPSSRTTSRELLSPRDHSRDRWIGSLFQASLFLLDSLLILGGFFAAWMLPHQLNLFELRSDIRSGEILTGLGVTILSILTVFSFTGMYRLGRGTSRIDEFYKVCTHLTLGTIIGLTLSILLVGAEVVVSRRVLLIGWVFAIVGVSTGRFLYGAVAGALRSRGIAVRRLLIVGTGPIGSLLLESVSGKPQLGYDVIGFLSHQRSADPPRTFAGLPVYGTTARIADVARRHAVDEVIIVPEGATHEELLDVTYQLMDLPVNVKVYPDTFRLITNDELSISDLGGMPMVTVRNVGLRAWDRAVKRAMDLVIGVAVLIVASPLMLLLALLVKLQSSGPVFFVQERVGHDGVPFNLLKFRSMPVNAETETGPVFARKDDPRPTPIGKFMRRYSLDELPQFINVLLGEMSVVGPRPERPHFVEQFRQTIPRYMARHREKAGITGWAQVNGLRGDTSIEERTRYDLYYVENWSPLFDIKIIIKTLMRIFSDSNAY